ncbi:MAG: autotransporter outer membrane beta-barrel domain-containing protein, partial [Alphaproteobacteria bacterium]|nr:autotransporter outer membrane beta-barrel domain-containing protein [Alphaproteobacteria bacterium]
EWRHEFKDDQRTINVRFVQDLRADPQVFGFETEEPDRDFFEVGAGVSVAFDNGLQPFLSVRTLLGHDYFNSTTVSLGLRQTF